MNRLTVVVLVVLVSGQGCKTSSKFAPLAFWRPAAAEPAAADQEGDGSYANEPIPGTSEQAFSPMPPPLPPIPAAPSFDEPRPTPAPPALFPME